MANLLGIDYGERKVGVAVSVGALSSPLKVLKNTPNLLSEIKIIAATEKAEKIVVGISEGTSAQKARDFGTKLESFVGVKVVYKDETLSSLDAQRLSIESGMNRKKRKNMEDAFAAAIILQSYLDSD